MWSVTLRRGGKSKSRIQNAEQKAGILLYLFIYFEMGGSFLFLHGGMATL